MSSSTLSLRQICLQFLRENISVIYGPKDIVINGDVTEELLESISVYNQLTDEVLLMWIFNSKNTQLRRVRIHNASKLTTIGLKALKTHLINELKVCGLIECTVDQLISCLCEWSLLKLKYLNVSHSLLTNSDMV